MLRDLVTVDILDVLDDSCIYVEMSDDGQVVLEVLD